MSPDLQNYRIIHFATHGFADDENPRRSYIALSTADAQGKPRHGRLRLLDIYNLNLAADAVVLSACSTALGENVQGEGLVGMVRGFMYAGAARVVTSLWRVGDRPTADLMKLFYRGVILKDGLSPAAALRAAQVEMWKHEYYCPPYYWAAFVLQGEYRQHSTERSMKDPGSPDLHLNVTFPAMPFLCREWNISPEQFDGFLGWLAPDRNQAGAKYQDIRRRLIKIFASRGSHCPEDLADETINRVIVKVGELREGYRDQCR